MAPRRGRDRSRHAGRLFFGSFELIVDHCRLLGCWLKLRDRTGELFVDLARAGLSARGLPYGAEVELRGHIGTTCEGKIGFVACSLRVLK